MDAGPVNYIYRDILVHVGAQAVAQGRLRLGLALASRAGARLTGVHVSPPADVAPAPGFLLAEALERRTVKLEAQARDAAVEFDDEVGVFSRATWRSLSCDVVEGICRCASSADLVIVGQSEWRQPAHKYPLPLAHSIIRRCGRPVLVVPTDHAGGTPRRIVIGWNSSREAVRAVHDAMPLLISAESIDIVADVPADDESGAALAEHLTYHGCVSPPNVIVSNKVADPRELLSEIIGSGDHDLLVMGGSTHPTWRETIFGGVTRSILMTSKIPVLAAI